MIKQFEHFSEMATSRSYGFLDHVAQDVWSRPGPMNAEMSPSSASLDRST